MNREIVSQTRKRNFAGNATSIFLPFLCIILIQSSLFSQTKPGSGNNPRNQQTTTNDIIIHQEINFKTTTQQLYQVLLNSKKFSACTKKSFNNFSEKSAIIDSAVGGTFSLFDGHIIGRILELVPNQRIVEAWRVVDWPAGVYSIAKFEFKAYGSGTQLIFDHTGFPEGLKKHLSDGWQQHYWDALNKYFQR